jgi:hypothetical protein
VCKRNAPTHFIRREKAVKIKYLFLLEVIIKMLPFIYTFLFVSCFYKYGTRAFTFQAFRTELSGPQRKAQERHREILKGEFHTSHYSSAIIKEGKSRRMKYAGNFVRLGKVRNTYRI